MNTNKNNILILLLQVTHIQSIHISQKAFHFYVFDNKFEFEINFQPNSKNYFVNYNRWKIKELFYFCS